MNLFRRYDVKYVPNQHGLLSTVVIDRWRHSSTRFGAWFPRDMAIDCLKQLRAECAKRRSA